MLKISLIKKFNPFRILFVFLFFTIFVNQIKGNTYFVTTNSDSGPGSLRQAIIDANGNLGADVIEFNVGGGGAQSITVSTDLPVISEALTIDGTTQPGYMGSPLISIGNTYSGNILQSNNSGAMVYTALNLGKGGTGGGIGIVTNNLSSLTITNCVITNRSYALHLTNSANLTITNNDFTDCAFSGSNGFVINMQSCTGSLSITGNTYGGNSFQGIRLAGGMTNIVVGDNTGNIQVGVQLKEFSIPLLVETATNITLENLNFGKTSPGGYVSLGFVTGLTVNNCILTNRVFSLYINNSSNLSITNNDFTNSGYSGSNGHVLNLESITGSLSVTGNTFGGATNNGIRLGNTHNITFGANTGNIQVGNQLKEISVPIEIIGGSNNTITGLDLSRTVTGGYINIDNVSGITVSNNMITNRNHGIILSNSSNVTIVGNDFTNSGVNGGWAMYLQSLSGTLVATGNTFGGNTSQGIRMGSISGKTIGATTGHIQVGNQLKEISVPIEIQGGSNDTITGLDLAKTTSGGYINVNGINGLVITNNIITNRTFSMIVQNSSNIKITGNDLTNSGVNGGYAIYLNGNNGTNMDISGNIFGGATTAGLYVGSCSNISIEPSNGQIRVGAQLKPFDTPLKIEGGSNIAMKDLDLEKNGAVGSHIEINSVNGITVTNCILRNRIHGLVIQYSSNITATGNNLTDSGVNGGYAIFLNGDIGTNMDVSNNTIGGVTTAGLYVGSCSNITISPSSGQVKVGSLLKPLANPLTVTSGNNITVTGLDLEKSGAAGSAVSFTGTNGITVTNNIFKNRNNGLIFQSCSNVTATGNDLSNSGIGNNYLIHLDNIGGTMNISGNTLSTIATYGLYMNNCTNRIISDGSVANTNVVIPDSSVFKNMSGSSIYILNSNGITIENVDLENTGTTNVGTGIYVENSQNTNITKNQILKRLNGLVIPSNANVTTHVNITCNNIKNNTNGIVFTGTGSGNRLVNNNIIWNNTTGINNSTSSPVQTIDATNNFWGSAAGPGAGGNNGTIGSNITTSPFSTTLPGCAPANLCEIDVLGNNLSINDGATSPSVNDSTYLGGVLVSGGSLVRTFKIKNTGTNVLILDGMPLVAISGANASDFTVISMPADTIYPGDSATFTISFDPSAGGLRTALVSIDNNDFDEDPFDFVIQGDGLEPGASLNFDGSNDYVQVNSGTSLNVSTAFTYEGWIKVESTSELFPTIFSRSVSNAMWLQGGNVSHNWIIAARINGSDVASTTTIPENIWTHVALTYENGSAKLFINGNLDASASLTTPGTGFNLYLGFWNGFGRYFHGSIDEFRIWNRALCFNEIQNNMNCEIPATNAGLVANYHFNHGIAQQNNAGITSLTDVSGNNNNGTLNNFALNGATSNWVNPGGVLSGVSCAAFSYPEINVKGTLNSIADGETSTSIPNGTNFGSVGVGSNVVKTFTIENLGTSNLNVTNITSSNALFAIGTLTPASPVNFPNGTATFTVTFTPSAAGTQNATITIFNNDCNESVYDFAITGQGYNPGAALDFDGINDEVAVASAPLSSVNATIEAWVKPALRSDGSVFTQFPNNVISTDIPGAYGRGFGVNVVSGSSGIALEYHNGFRYINYAFTPGQWYHVAVVYTASNIKTYVNAVLVDDLNVSNSGSNGMLQIGKHNTDGAYGTRRFFKGSIDEIRVWNKALCVAEIQWLKNCEIPAASGGLLLNYHFNQGIAGENNAMVTSLTDASGNNTNGTLSSFTLNGTSSNWVTPGGVISGSACTPYAPGIINVKGNNMTIVDGDPSPSTLDFTDFNGGFSRKFKIENTGSGPLLISSMLSTNSAFVINNAPTTIAAGATDSFTLVFMPNTAGTSTSTININSNDCNTSLFNFNVSATATAAKALHFDGIDDEVIGNSNTTFFGTTPTTIEFWCKPNDNTFNFIGDLGFTYQLLLTANGKLNLSGFSIGNLSTAANLVPINTWTHCAITYDGSQTNAGMKAYINGAPVAFTGSFSSFPQVTNAQLRLGIANNNYHYAGALDEVRIWNESRTPTQILASYNTELAGMDPCLIYYYKFNQGFIGANNSSITTIPDIANFAASNGTISNMALNGSTSNFVAGSGITENTSVYIPAPEIDIKGGSPLVSITDGDSSPSTADDTDFGSISSPITKNFTITNSGTALLNITNVTIDGVNASDFSVMTQPVAAVGPGGQASFVIKFTPSLVGTRTAVIHLNNDDCDESDYNFTVQATSTCLPPSFTTCSSNLVVNTGANSCTATVNYNISVSGTPTPTLTYAFTGATIGTGSGTGTGNVFNKGLTNVVVTATNACGAPTCSFTVTVNDNQDPTISCPGNVLVNNDYGFCAAVVNYLTPVGSDNCPNAVTTLIGGLGSGASFPIGTTTNTFKVTDEAGRMATCSFNVTVKASDLDLFGNGIEITSGDMMPDLSDSTAFGITLPNVSITRNFTITNNGSIPLNINGIASDDAEFIIGTFGSNMLNIGESTTFPITFTSNQSGLKDANIIMTNNSCSEESFTYKVNATVGCPHPHYMFTGNDMNDPTNPALAGNWLYGCVPPANDASTIITIQQGETFKATGIIMGDVINYGKLTGKVIIDGNLTNNGVLSPGN